MYRARGLAGIELVPRGSQRALVLLIVELIELVPRGSLLIVELIELVPGSS